MAQIKGVSITATTVKELKATIDELRGALLQLSKADEQYDEKVQQLQAHQAKLNEVMALTSKATMQEKQAISAVAGSYDELVAKAAQLRKEWRAMEIGTPEWTKQAEEINKITTQLKDADAAIGNHQRNVGNYAGGVIDAFTQLRGEIKKYKAELLQAEEGSEEYRQALAKLGEAQFRMKDMAEQAKYAVADVGEVLGAVSKTAQGVVGGFNAMQGVMALAGGESENLQKVMVKLQAGMAIVQGLQGLEGMIDSVKGLQIVLNGGIKRVVAFVKSLGALKTAIISTGVGALVVALGTLIGKLSEANNEMEKGSGFAEKYNEGIRKALQALDDTFSEIKDDTVQFKIRDIKRLSEELKNAGGEASYAAKKVEEFNESVDWRKNREREAEIEAIDKRIGIWLAQREALQAAGKNNKLYYEDEINELTYKRNQLVLEQQQDIVKNAEAIVKIEEEIALSKLSDREKELYLFRQELLKRVELYKKMGVDITALVKYGRKKRSEINEKYDKKDLEDRERAADLQRSMEIHIAQDQQERWQRFADEREAMLKKAMEGFAQAADFIEREAQAAEEELTSWADTYLKGVDAERQGIEKNIEAVKQVEAEKLRYANISKDTEKERAKAIYDIKQQSLFDEAALLRQGLESGVLYGEQRVEAEERIAQIERDIAYNTAEYKIEQNQRAASTIVRVLSSSANAMGNILGSIADMYEQEGEANQEAMEKAKNLRIAGATMDMLGGVVAALSGLFTDKSGPWDFILAGIQAASILASGIANISKIKQTDVSGKRSGGTSGTSAIVSAPAIVQQVPITRTLTGVAEEERLNQASRVYVVYDDIAQVGRKVEVTETETTF